MLFYFIRHGDPCYDPDSLTPLGLRQAEAIGRRLSCHGMDRIYSSPLKRAMQTARPAAELLRKEIIPVEFASESIAWKKMTAQDDQGRTHWAFAHPGIKKLFATEEMRSLGMEWFRHPAFENNAFREYMEWMAGESNAFFSSLGYETTHRPGFYRAVQPNEERVALFAHGGFGTAFLSHVLGIPYPQFSQMINISHTSLTVIEFSPHAGECIPVILTFANDAHLYHEHLPLYDRAQF